MAKKTFLYGAVILSVSGMIAKVLGAIFRIPLVNIIGADGMAYYNGAYPVYVLLFTLSIAGTPIAISRMVSEKIAFGDYYGAHRIFKVILTAMCIVGAALFGILFFGAKPITGMMNSLGDAVYAMKALSPALFFLSVLAVFRGYFQGMQNMRPSAVIQVVEQFFRVGFGLSLAVAFLGQGKPFAAAGATFGATAGSAAALLVAYLIYRSQRKQNTFSMRLRDSRREHLRTQDRPQSVTSILSGFLVIAIPIMIGACIMPIMNNIDLWIVTSRLADSGLEPDAIRSLYGQLTGMAGPLINLPQVITQAIGISLVPTVVAAYKTKDRKFMQHNVVLSIRTTLIVALPCTVGLLVLAEPIMKLLYMKQIEAAISAAPTLAILAVGVVFLASIQTLTCVLQGIERQFVPVINLFIGAVCKAVLTFFLTGIPSVNIKGAAIGTVCAYIVATALNFRSVAKHTGARFKWHDTLVKPLISAGAMGIAAFGSYHLILIFTGNGIATLAAIAIGALCYVILLFATKAVTEEELTMLPKGEKLAKLYRRFLTKKP